MYVCAHLKVNTCVHQTPRLDSWPKCDKMHVSGVPRERNMSILLQHRQHHKSCQKPFSISQLSHLISDVLGKLKVFIEEEKNQSNWRVYVQEGKSNFRSRRKKKRRKPPAPVANRNTQDQKRKKSGKTNKLPSETNLFGAPNVILAERDEQEEIHCRPPSSNVFSFCSCCIPFPVRWRQFRHSPRPDPP